MIDYGIDIYADGADIQAMRALDEAYPGLVAGWTTNPTLMRRAGVTDYQAFAREAIGCAAGRPISFEVVTDDLHEMCRQGEAIASWGDSNIYVKIPVMTTTGLSTGWVIHELLEAGVNVNITAVLGLDWFVRVVEDIGSAPLPGHAIISVFAGRIANTGANPVAAVTRFRQVLHGRQSQALLLWASPRQVYDVVAARTAGAHAITLTPALIGQLCLLGRSLEDYCLETVQMFYDDAQAAGYQL